jgi:hypothetical protein
MCESNKPGGEKHQCTAQQLLNYRIISDRLGYEPWEAANGYISPPPVDVTNFDDWNETVDQFVQSGQLKLEL